MEGGPAPRMSAIRDHIALQQRSTSHLTLPQRHSHHRLRRPTAQMLADQAVPSPDTTSALVTRPFVSTAARSSSSSARAGMT